MSFTNQNKILLLSLILSLVSGISIYAQEGGVNPNTDGYDGVKPENQYDRYTPSVDLEGKMILNRPAVSKDTLAVKSSSSVRNQSFQPLSSEKEPEKTASSFNLFYYMFQKFKLNDIIDQ